jgi:hypothetical protein
MLAGLNQRRAIQDIGLLHSIKPWLDLLSANGIEFSKIITRVIRLGSPHLAHFRKQVRDNVVVAHAWLSTTTRRR